MQGPRAAQSMTALSMHEFLRWSTGRHGDTHLCDQHNSKSEQADDVPLRQRGSTYCVSGKTEILPVLRLPLLVSVM